MIKTNVLKFKKAVAVFIAMLMIVLSFSYTANSSSDAANTSRTYKVYNATNGNYLRSYTLAPLETNNNTRTVIGIDERVIDWTKSGVVKIMSDSYYIGSGFVVDEHTIATAAHCVYNKSISEILLFDTSGNIEKNIIPMEYHIPTQYVPSSKFDYALITVEEDLSNYMCFELGVPCDSFINGSTNATVSVTGFPQEYNDHTNHMKYSGNGKICSGGSGENGLLYYNADTSGGNSGGPVYITELLNGRTYHTVVAVHTTGGNHGVCMTTDLIHFYKANNNLRY